MFDIIPLGIPWPWIDLHGELLEETHVLEVTGREALLRLGDHVIELLFLLLYLAPNRLPSKLDTHIDNDHYIKKVSADKNNTVNLGFSTESNIG
jgi:hypothetical protein